MKRNFTTLLSTALVASLSLPLLAQDEPEQPAAATPVPAPIEAPSEEPAQDAPGQNVQQLLEAVIDAGSEPALEGAMPIIEGGGERPAGESFIREGGTTPRFVRPNRSATNRTAAVTAENFSLNSTTPATPPDKVVKEGERAIWLNFRNAPLEMVLSYLSDVAGFIIVPKTDVRGKIDAWSNQPLTKDEAVALLNQVLGEEGYAVIRDGRTLTVMTQAAAKKSDIPVTKGGDPTRIPKNQQIVTQIIPVRFLGAVQLAKDLQPLMPTQMTLTANEAGNALLITDTQANIRRLAEIIYALDTSVSSMSAVRVFALQYADAKTVADMVKEVFGNTGNSGGGGGGGGRGRGGGGGGFSFGGLAGLGGLAGAAGGEGGSSGRPGASKVVAAADERSNSLVVSAPDDLMPTIEQLIKAVDMNVDDLTEIRAFSLMHADPQETATLLTSLFPDPTAQGGQRGGFGNFTRGGFGQTAGAASGDSNRMKKQSKVVAVPDNRTRSIVVTAARDTMQQIEGLIKQLDNDPARKKQLYVIDVQNTDPETVKQALDDIFSGQRNSNSTRNRNTTGQPGGQLNQRTRQQSQNGGTRNTGFGGSGGGGVGGGGAFGGN